MTALAGDLPNYEEAYRSLDAGDRSKFEELTGGWPRDVREHLLSLAKDGFPEPYCGASTTTSLPRS